MQEVTAVGNDVQSHEERRNQLLKKTMQVVEQSVNLARQYGTPMHPYAYEIWYTFLEGKNRELTNSIREMMRENPPFDEGRFQEIYDKYISLQFARDRIDGELDTAMFAASNHLENLSSSVGAYANTLDNVNAQLEFVKMPPFVADSIQLLKRANKELCDVIQVTSGQLEKSTDLIGQLRNEMAKVQEAAYNDELTKLGNRRAFEKELNRHICLANSHHHPLCLAMIDIDHFKSFNDKYGHLVGDSILRYVADFIKKLVPDGVVVCRFGGEEFAVIMPKFELKNAVELLENIRGGIERSSLQTTQSKKPVGCVTCSFGVTKYRDKETRDAIVERSDGLLYLAKQNGRNRTVCDARLVA